MKAHRLTVTVVTPTGDRPEAFALCERWVARQTRPPDQWVVVDDGETPTPRPAEAEYVRRTEHPGLTASLTAALPRVRGDALLIVEDDDWYAPTYVEEMADRLSRHPLVGECRARWYNVSMRRWRVVNNTRHASLCQTGLRRELFPLLATCCDTSDPFVDARLWRESVAGRHLFAGRGLCVGMKGMPGRAGQGKGHHPGRRGDRGFLADRGGSKLRQWIGDDAEAYLGLFPANGANP